jgi:hypothetical protein
VGAGEIASLAIGLISTAFGAAKNMGILGNPDWVKYADAGLFIAGKATTLLSEVTLNPSKYDKMTPAEITVLLTPATWDEIEAEAKRQIAAGG